MQIEPVSLWGGGGMRQGSGNIHIVDKLFHPFRAGALEIVCLHRKIGVPPLATSARKRTCELIFAILIL